MGVDVKDTRLVDKDFIIEKLTQEMQRSWNRENKTELDKAYANALFVARDTIMKAPVITLRETKYGRCILHGESENTAACQTIM